MEFDSVCLAVAFKPDEQFVPSVVAHKWTDRVGVPMEAELVSRPDQKRGRSMFARAQFAETFK